MKRRAPDAGPGTLRFPAAYGDQGVDVERRQERSPLRHRTRYLFDRTLARSTATLLGWLALCCLAVVVPVSTLLVWTDPDAPHSLSGRLTQVWRTSAETLRLSVATGAPLRMLLSVLLGLIALLCVSTVVGVVTTGLGDRLAELRRGRSRVVERGHTVVLGWSDQVFTVVEELISAHAAGDRQVITVLADRDPTAMERALMAALGVTDGVRLECRTGVPSDPDTLRLVSLGAARAVVVLPAEGPDGDLRVVRILLALRTVLGAHGGPRVVAAVHDERRVPAARLAVGPRGTVLGTDQSTARLLVQCARNPGMSTVLRDLLDFSGAEFHVVDVPQTTGLSFGEVALRLETSSAVGLLRADGRPLLTPPPGTVLEAGDRLVTVAHDDGPPPLSTHRAPVDPTAVARTRPRPEHPYRLLLLGWNRRAPLIVDTLCRTARPDSTLDLVTGLAAPCIPPRAASSSLRLTHHLGDPSAPETLTGLDLSAYDRVLALGADQQTETAPERADDRTLLAMLTLRSWEEETSRVLPVVAEMRDHRSRTLAPLGPAGDVVVAGELTALLMAQIVHTPELAAVFEEIFAVRGGALALRSAAHYVRPGREASFATVVAAGIRNDEYAIGYRPHVPRPPRSHGTVHLCPGKSERRVWNAEDEILVLTPGHTEPAPNDLARLALPAMRPGPGEHAESQQPDSPPTTPGADISP
ncbi:NAD-binding lipoprotein [Streptomyces sp. NBC_01239]|uniref:CASTOR/POLLUX-related putative ion channel n=1 Tax=Streptomyces sp. NBC_01239 TaxID=2903792 RepID=UPI00224E5AB9|nr:NAD-binding lipoprotein [Streptomyces sp. NBC_01239]MCX4817854.1 NAD-binding lipoprotein [Streptomyces sp. NBC_01239]